MSTRLLITGASSGIGRAAALLAAARGYHVAVHYHQQQAQAEQVVAQIRTAGGQAVPLQADLTRERDIERLYQEVDQTLGGLDAVINSAGISLRRAPARELDGSELTRLFSLNVAGVLLSCREAIKRLGRNTKDTGQRGVILNLSSMAASIGGRPGSAAYAASKAAVDAFSVGLAKEVAAEGIRVLSVRPGMVETEMTRASLADASFRATIAASIPLGRPAQADEVARPLLWLLSSEASFITGTTIDISGGGFRIAG
jgi:NAD(P)-dependent dehydrogenase (short-subunit alcohol dehydrogenase family)